MIEKAEEVANYLLVLHERSNSRLTENHWPSCLLVVDLIANDQFCIARHVLSPNIRVITDLIRPGLLDDHLPQFVAANRLLV